MGVSIDLHVYDYFELVKQIQKVVDEAENVPEGRTVQIFVDDIMPKFGFRAGDKFITLWNEYYEEYNSGAELMHAVDLYFGTEDTFLGGYEYGQHTNAHEVLSELDIEPIEESDDYDY